jgi:hypothetical protein
MEAPRIGRCERICEEFHRNVVWIAEIFTFATRLISRLSNNRLNMYWTLELASYLEDAPWPATKDELIDFAMRTGAPLEVVENLQQIEDDEEVFDTIEDIWPDYPTKEDFFFNEDEY